MRYYSGESSLPKIEVSASEVPLSEAMILGGAKHPQKFGGFYDKTDDGDVTSTCGIVAALDAVDLVDGVVKNKQSVSANTVFPALDYPVDGCPACGQKSVPDFTFWSETELNVVAAVIMHLNDDHRWTRPRQAAWVKSIEQAHDANQLETQQEAPSALQTSQTKRD